MLKYLWVFHICSSTMGYLSVSVWLCVSVCLSLYVSVFVCLGLSVSLSLSLSLSLMDWSSRQSPDSGLVLERHLLIH